MNMHSFSNQHKGKVVMLYYLKLGTSVAAIEMCVIYFFTFYFGCQCQELL